MGRRDPPADVVEWLRGVADIWDGRKASAQAVEFGYRHILG